MATLTCDNRGSEIWSGMAITSNTTIPYDNIDNAISSDHTTVSEGETMLEQRKLTLLVSIFRLLLALVILAVNIITIYTFCRVKALRTKSNALLISLAVSDLLVGLGALVAVHVSLRGPSEHDGEALAVACTVYLFILLLCCCVSLLSICLINLERYIYIVHPYRYLQYVSNKILGISITATWTSMSILFGCGLAMSFQYRAEKPCDFSASFTIPVVNVYIPFGIFTVSGLTTFTCCFRIARLSWNMSKATYPEVPVATVAMVSGDSVRRPEDQVNQRATSPPSTVATQPPSSGPASAAHTCRITRRVLRALKAPVVIFGCILVSWTPHMTVYMIHLLLRPVSTQGRSMASNLIIASSAMNFFIHLIFNSTFRKAVFGCLCKNKTCS